MMELVEIDVVDTEAPERTLDGIEDMLSGVAAIPGARAHRPEALGGDHEIVAPARQPPAQDLFRTADGLEAPPEWIDIGGVETVMPALAARSRMATDAGSSHCSPKVIVPRQRRETWRPVRPSRTWRMA
jgi:hypothetical protein